MTSDKGCMKFGKTGVRAAFLAGIVALAGNIPPASAEEYGVGVIHEGAGSTVLFPIRTGSLNIEPELSYSKISSDTQPRRSWRLATGVYLRRQLGSSFESSIGGRVGYFRSKSTFGTSEIDVDAWFVTPAAGIQYFFAKQFSIGFDVGLEYSRLAQRTTISIAVPPVDNTDHVHNVETVTRIMLRAYF